ncbi:hypothetical protein AAMO2058_000363500 [Amorphochlora amoebiformis]
MAVVALAFIHLVSSFEMNKEGPRSEEKYTVRRARVLREIGDGEGRKDLSPKGSIDAPIADLIREINTCPEECVYTTSSCSGRITLFTQATSQRKGGHWDICSHDKVTHEDVEKAIHGGSPGTGGSIEGGDSKKEGGRLMSMRFEPFILCCECRDMATAYRLLGVANRSGMRESGIMGGPKRFLVGIRCSLRLEVPVKKDGKPLIDRSFTRFLVDQANSKFDQNLVKIDAFRAAFKSEFYPNPNPPNLTPSASPLQESKGKRYQAVVCFRRDAKTVKDKLKSLSLLKPRTPSVPVLPENPGDPPRLAFAVSRKPEGGEEGIRAAIGGMSVWLKELDEPASRKGPKKTNKQTPWDRMVQAARKAGQGAEEARRMPKKWHKIGDIALFPSGDWTSSARAIGATVWSAVASVLGVSRVAIQGEIKSEVMRRPRVEIVWRSPEAKEKGGWVTQNEGGVKYRLDVTRSMFCKGNGTEKKRVGQICHPGDVVVDLYAGIGYFVLPYLIHGKATHVHACEINPASIEALRQSLKSNGVESRCTVHAKNNKDLAGKDFADRVNLGLLPSSEGGWPIAVRVLKPEGGYLHVHGNCADTDTKAYAESVREAIERLAQASGDPRKQDWNVNVTHIEKVKWYAPRVRHVVVDIHCHQKK